ASAGGQQQSAGRDGGFGNPDHLASPLLCSTYRYCEAVATNEVRRHTPRATGVGRHPRLPSAGLANVRNSTLVEAMPRDGSAPPTADILFGALDLPLSFRPSLWPWSAAGLEEDHG